MGTRLAKPALDPGIVTRDPEPLIAFYVNVFGLERLDPLTIPSVGTIHKLAGGESILRIMRPESEPQPGDGPGDWSARAGIRYLTIEVEDARAAAEAVRENGGAVVLEPFELRPGRFVCQAHDPDGNMIEIGQG
jgi:predicted enzyme related to lactoylglutathione lyase